MNDNTDTAILAAAASMRVTCAENCPMGSLIPLIGDLPEPACQRDNLPLPPR